YTSINDNESFVEEFKVENIGPETELKEFTFEEILENAGNGDTVYYYSTFVSENNNLYNDSIRSFELERKEDENTILELTLLTVADFFDVGIDTAETIVALIITIVISIYVAAGIDTSLSVYISILSLITFSFIGWIPTNLIILIATLGAAIIIYSWSD
ncbi:MAG: hypothetical protein ACLFUH_03975, partial [Bacteroidales bacterium]